MFLRILAILLFSAGLVLLLYGSYATNSMPHFSLYVSFFGSLLWAIGAIFIIFSRSSVERIQIRSPKS